MRCDECLELVSARLDGEASLPGDPPPEAVDAHLASCASCRTFAGGAADLHRDARVRAAEPVPDLTAAVMADAPELGPARAAVVLRRERARYALLAVALTMLVLAVPMLFGGDGGSDAVHASRELGSVDVALAIGLLVVARQPQRAAGLLPFAAALAATMAVTAVVDVARGDAGALGEAHHALELVGVVLLWVVAHPERRPGWRPGAVRAAGVAS